MTTGARAKDSEAHRPRKGSRMTAYPTFGNATSRHRRAVVSEFSLRDDERLGLWTAA
jgi:hypothetical protein